MTKFKFSPIKQISIHQIFHTSENDLVNRFSHPENPYPLMWVDGILFVRIPFTETESLINREIKGHIHWKILEFAKFDIYQKTITRSDGLYTSPIINVSANDIFSSFAKWLKTQKVWENI